MNPKDCRDYAEEIIARTGTVYESRFGPGDLIPIIHYACGKPVAFATERPRMGDRPDLTKLRHVDGNRIFAGEPTWCATCQRRFHLEELVPEGGFAAPVEWPAEQIGAAIRATGVLPPALPSEGPIVAVLQGGPADGLRLPRPGTDFVGIPVEGAEGFAEFRYRLSHVAGGVAVFVPDDGGRR